MIIGKHTRFYFKLIKMLTECAWLCDQVNFTNLKVLNEIIEYSGSFLSIELRLPLKVIGMYLSDIHVLYSTVCNLITS